MGYSTPYIPGKIPSGTHTNFCIAGILLAPQPHPMKLLITTALCCTLASSLHAQHFLGTATSNHNTSDAVFLNPAHLAGTPQKLNIHLFALNFALDNNFATINSGTAIRKYLAGEQASTTDVFEMRGKENFNLLLPYAETRLLGATYRVNAKHTVGVHSRVRATNQFHNFDRNLYQQIIDGTLIDEAGNFQGRAERFNWNTHIWGELGASYAGTPWKYNGHTIKVGASLRYLGGIAYGNFRSDGLDVAYFPSADSTQVTNSSLYFSSNLIENQDELADGFTRAYLTDYFNSRGGKGIGGDIGVAYEFTPQHGQIVKMHKYDRGLGTEPYLLRLSAAITDIGSIRYSNTNKTAHFRGSGSVTTSDLDSLSFTFPDIKGYLATRGFDVDTSSEATVVALPTALHLHADYNIWSRWYVSLTYIGNLANRYRAGTAFYNTVTLTPRFDGRRVGAALPITYSGMTGGMKMGLGLRVLGFRAGSDDLLALVSDNSTGVNFYFGASIPINRPLKPKPTPLPIPIPGL